MGRNPDASFDERRVPADVIFVSVPYPSSVDASVLSAPVSGYANELLNSVMRGSFEDPAKRM